MLLFVRRRPAALANGAEPSLSLTVIRYGAVDLPRREIGPHEVRVEKLAVCALPQQEIRNAFFSARPDHKIGVGHARRSRGSRKTSLPSGRPACGPPSRQSRANAAAARSDLIAAAVVEAQVHLKTLNMRVQCVRARDERAKVCAERRQVAENDKPDAVLFHLLDGLVEIFVQQAHDGVDLALRALPILRGKCKNGEITQADVLAVRRDRSEYFASCRMARRARQLFCAPPSVRCRPMMTAMCSGGRPSASAATFFVGFPRSLMFALPRCFPSGMCGRLRSRRAPSPCSRTPCLSAQYTCP